jgi:hypothetical protein
VARRRLFAGVYRVLVIHGWKRGRLAQPVRAATRRRFLICHLSAAYLSPRARRFWRARLILPEDRF